MAKKGMSTINTVLKFGTEKASLTKLTRIKSYPALGGDPEQIEITDLEDLMAQFCEGVQQLQSMQFRANYTKEEFDNVNAKAHKQGFFELDFGKDGEDGMFEWEGTFSVYVTEGEVNAAREMVITVFPSTDITPKE